MFDNAVYCKRCVLPERKPDIWFDEQGVCNLCVEHEERKRKRHKDHDRPLLETDLTALLNKYRGKNRYDCLVMCSGGKDSTASLYYMVKKYKLKTLAYTFDHGFESAQAYENVKNAVRILQTDWLSFRSGEMRDIFGMILRSNSSVPMCHVCALWYMRLTFDIAVRFDIPVIVAGWTKGQSLERGEHGREYMSMSQSTEAFIKGFLRKDPRYKDFPLSMREVVSRARKKFKGVTVSPHWFIRQNVPDTVALLSKELQWEAPRQSYPLGSTNCLMNFVSVYRSMRDYGYTHYHVEASKLIRAGELTREEALRQLAITFDKAFLDDIVRRLNNPLL